MQKCQYTVGEVSKITGISKDTLRFYDKIGLFQPAIKSPLNGYRYYSIDQFWYIDIILCFRKLGLPIERIKRILSYRDNDHIVDILNEQKQEAERIRDYYAGVVEDINWYSDQNARIEHYSHGGVHVEQLAERRVIFGDNSRDEPFYHIKLQENCHEELLHAESIKRSYGYVLHTEGLADDRFLIRGEYVSIGNGVYPRTEPSHILTIPGGRYACFITNVRGQTADFSPLRAWLERSHMETDYVVADEIGLQLFYYNQFNYPCEIRARLRAP